MQETTGGEPAASSGISRGWVELFPTQALQRRLYCNYTISF